MADYDFYVNAYLGSSIQEKAFPSLAAQAASVLASFERRYQVSGGSDSRNMAICAMAECLQENARRGIASASVGQTSVHYSTEAREPLERQLYRKAAIYLDIYRGVS